MTTSKFPDFAIAPPVRIPRAKSCSSHPLPAVIEVDFQLVSGNIELITMGEEEDITNRGLGGRGHGAIHYLRALNEVDIQLASDSI